MKALIESRGPDVRDRSAAFARLVLQGVLCAAILAGTASSVPAPTPSGPEGIRPSDAILLPPMFVTPLRPPPLYGHALLRNWVAPDYPKDALKQWLGGTVKLRLVIDKKGNVVSSRVLDATDPRFVKAAQDAVKEWTFSPALSASMPVACSMDTSAVFSPEEATRHRSYGSTIPPEAELPVLAPTIEATLASAPDIDYPDVLYDRRLSGRAHYICTVLANGRVANPRIIAASNVDFVVPALNAIANLRYNPRMQGDEPIEAEVEGDLKFDLTMGSTSGALAVNGITAPDGSSPTAAVEPRTVVDPIYPYALLQKGEKGSAAVAFTVGTNGSPTEIHVIAASEPEFGVALAAAVAMSTFSPPAVKGHSAPVPLVRRADFAPAASGADSGKEDPVARLWAALQAGQVGNGTGLDARLTPRYQVAPRYPDVLRLGDRPAGQAVVEFIVDRDGRARLPQVFTCSDPAFGWAAATAVSQWVFDPPRRDGRSADVRARVPFEFKAPKD
jgi:TonB family protein